MAAADDLVLQREPVQSALGRADRLNNYARLLQVKERYDPDGLFLIHLGTGT
jgi:FAD/FMN-containing dehydrogenase